MDQSLGYCHQDITILKSATEKELLFSECSVNCTVGFSSANWTDYPIDRSTIGYYPFAEENT